MADHMRTSYSVPDVIRPAIEKEVGYLIGLLPGWVNHLYVDFQSYAPDKDEGGTRATMTADYAYRRAYLNIYPAWLNDSETERRVTITHEAVHVLNAPVASFVQALVSRLFADQPALEKVVAEQWRIANEAATEDTAVAILSAIADHEALDEDTSEKPESVTPLNDAR